MPLSPRAAAYTRTGILRRFLDQLGESIPPRVDNAYAQERLGLKGGDVRAFLQSLRVLGLVDPYGGVTDVARRTRALTQRAAVIQESLQQAYPELVQRWENRGGMPREEVEDFFKVEYGLSASSAGPAAKLFCDLKREYAPRPPSSANGASEPETPLSAPLPQSTPMSSPPAPAPPGDVRVAAFDAVKSAIHIEINGDWETEKIELVFNRMERLVDRILQN
jgi:hypothetical protein